MTSHLSFYFKKSVQGMFFRAFLGFFFVHNGFEKEHIHEKIAMFFDVSIENALA